MRRISLVALTSFVLVCVATASLDAQKRKPRPRPSTAKPVPAARAAAVPPPTERVVPFKAGETLTYDVSWSSYVTAGVATMTVKEKRPSFGSTAYYIVGEGRPSGLVSALYSVYYKADTLLDVYTLLPQRGSLYSQEGKRRRMKVTRFNQAARTADFEVRTASVVKRSVALPPYVQDALSAVYVLRAVQLKEGDRFAMPVSDGGTNYRVMFAVGRREPVKVGPGSFTAFRITPTITDSRGQSVGRAMSVWLSDDARKLPLKLQADLPVGNFNLTLREAR
jgi:hypothetical protein